MRSVLPYGRQARTQMGSTPQRRQERPGEMIMQWHEMGRSRRATLSAPSGSPQNIGGSHLNTGAVDFSRLISDCQNAGNLPLRSPGQCHCSDGLVTQCSLEHMAEGKSKRCVTSICRSSANQGFPTASVLAPAATTATRPRPAPAPWEPSLGPCSTAYAAATQKTISTLDSPLSTARAVLQLDATFWGARASWRVNGRIVSQAFIPAL
jgi:hypothetical protein